MFKLLFFWNRDIIGIALKELAERDGPFRFGDNPPGRPLPTAAEAGRDYAEALRFKALAAEAKVELSKLEVAERLGLFCEMVLILLGFDIGFDIGFKVGFNVGFNDAFKVGFNAGWI